MSRVQARRAALAEVASAARQVQVLHRPPASPRRLTAQVVHQQQLVRAYRAQAHAAFDASTYFLAESPTQLSLLALGNTSTTLANRLDDELQAAVRSGA
ncbi:hypothetical protein [Saccharothrix texasensis]|uniref:Uncharacterized protein n=1 Tax=Saccharothrix texasensis TaxID=103734 RepID=A0A3N1H1H5_9PSEU|nr:hypothetical protein [Saccharothrix texasensis]ROP36256.1 hypothetical protein EDD40_1521 [Saccharothrix texasensis]